MSPKVSVCILTWNHVNYIEQCLLSLNSQTFQDFEVLYLDNISTDGTYEKALEILASSQFSYRVFKNESPQSIPVNLNKLIKEAKGKYVALISGDDWFTPNCLFEKYKYFESVQNVGLLFSGGWYYYEDTGAMEELNTSKFSKGKVFELLLVENFVFAPGIFLNKKIFETVGSFDENLKIEDYDMWLRVAMKYEIDFIDKPLVYYRRHSNNFSQYKNIDFIEDHIKMYRKYIPQNRKIAKKRISYWTRQYLWEMIIQRKPTKMTIKAFINYFIFDKGYFRMIISFLVRKTGIKG